MRLGRVVVCGVLVAAGLAAQSQVGGPTVLPQCSALRVTRCTPSIDATGHYIPPIGSSTALYYFTDTASDVGGDLQATQATYSPKTTLTYNLTVGTNNVQTWVTVPGVPDILSIPAGVYQVHLHLNRSSAPVGTVTVQGVIEEVSASGAYIATIGTTEPTPTLNPQGGEVEYELDYADSNTYTMASATSRLAVVVQAISSSTTPTVTVYVGGEADSHLSIPFSGGGGLPGGLNTAVQYNASGSLGGDSAKFAWLESSIGTPAAPTVTQHGTAGSTTYGYEIVWLTLAGSGPASTETQIATGNATLSGSNYNIVTPGACPATSTGKYAVIRSTAPSFPETGVLAGFGTCGSPTNDTNNNVLNMWSGSITGTYIDFSQGLYASQITSPQANFGVNFLTYPTALGGIPLGGAVTVYGTDATGLAGIDAFDDSALDAFGVQGAAIAEDGATGTGLEFLVYYNGTTTPASAPLYGVSTQLNNAATNVSASVPGWSAMFEAQTAAFQGAPAFFTNEAVVDAMSGTFGYFTGEAAVIHSSVAPGSPTIYFLLEEGGLPSLFAGTITDTPLKSATGQVFVCATTTGLLVSSATACVGTK